MIQQQQYQASDMVAQRDDQPTAVSAAAAGAADDGTAHADGSGAMQEEYPTGPAMDDGAAGAATPPGGPAMAFLSLAHRAQPRRQHRGASTSARHRRRLRLLSVAADAPKTARHPPPSRERGAALRTPGRVFLQERDARPGRPTATSRTRSRSWRTPSRTWRHGAWKTAKSLRS